MNLCLCVPSSSASPGDDNVGDGSGKWIAYGTRRWEVKSFSISEKKHRRDPFNSLTGLFKESLQLPRLMSLLIFLQPQMTLASDAENFMNFSRDREAFSSIRKFSDSDDSWTVLYLFLCFEDHGKVVDFVGKRFIIKSRKAEVSLFTRFRFRQFFIQDFLKMRSIWRSSW